MTKGPISPVAASSTANPASRRWGITQLPVQEKDYFLQLSRNVALQPYFFYHGAAVEFVERGRG